MNDENIPELPIANSGSGSNIIDVIEPIIENPKKQIQNLLKVCDLSWNENCLEFQMIIILLLMIH